MKSLYAVTLAFLIVAGGLALRRNTDQLDTQKPSPEPISLGKNLDPCLSKPLSIVDYIHLPIPSRIKESTALFKGSVTGISTTRWNQDNGEYWEDLSADQETKDIALPYYTLEISNILPLSYSNTSERRQVVTVIGYSPAECKTLESHGVTAGSTVVVFARQTELAWRHGETRSILGLTSNPVQSLLVQGSDGLFHEVGAPRKDGISIDDLRRQMKI